MCASVVAAFSCSFVSLCFFFHFYATLCCIIFSLHVTFFSVETQFLVQSNTCHVQTNTLNHNLMQTSILICFRIVCCQIYETTMNTRISMCAWYDMCWWCVFPWLDIVYMHRIARQTKRLWNAFMWFPISPFSNEAKIGCSTRLQIQITWTVRKIMPLLSLYQPP